MKRPIPLADQTNARRKLTSRGQVAILYRTNAQSGNFENIFIQEGIPYKIFGAFKFLKKGNQGYSGLSQNTQ